MTSEKLVLVFDCGATNVRVIAMDTKGQIVAGKAYPNNTQEDPNLPGGRIWDEEEIWGKLCKASQEVTSKIDKQNIVAATVTTFGVDGALYGKDKKKLYPIISWQCDRTTPIMENIDKYIPLKELYEINGVYPYNFNSINKFVWYKENRPELLNEAEDFLFMPSIFIEKLSGERVTDATMAGTSMLTDVKTRSFSEELLNRIGISDTLFPEMHEAGQVVGQVNKSGAEQTGLPQGVSVCVAGHDTQFAIFGSGADLNQPVLSSGTWEILMARSRSCTTTAKQLELGLTNELDAFSGIYNIGQNWLGSGMMEWGSNLLFPEVTGDKRYELMIGEAEKVAPGSNGVRVNPAFYQEAGTGIGGAFYGMNLKTNRNDMYRAMLESMAYRLREGLEVLEGAGGFKADKIICVGGGSKNRLWNQLRADVCQTPVQLINQKETTVLGAALFAFAGAGIFSSPEEARGNINYEPKIFEPSKNSSAYQALYEESKRKLSR